MGKIRRSAYREPLTPGGIKGIEEGSLERFDHEMFSNFNTGTLEQYLEMKNRKEFGQTSNFQLKKVLLIIILVGLPFTFITQYVALRTGVLLSGAFYISYLIGLGLKWTPSEINIGSGAATAAEKTITGFVFIFPSIYILASWGSDGFSGLGGEEGFTSIPWLILIIIASMITSLLGILIMARLRRLWIVEDPLPTPGFQATVKLLQISDSMRKGDKYQLKGTFRRIIYSSIVVIILGIFRDLPLVRINGPYYGQYIGSIRDLIFNSMGLGEWVMHGSITTPASISRYSRPTFQLSGMLFAVGWFLRLRGASILLAGSILSWFILIPMAVILGLPIRVFPISTLEPALIGLDDLKYEYFQELGLSGTSSIANLAYIHYIVPISIGVILGAGSIALIKVIPGMFKRSHLGDKREIPNERIIDFSSERYDIPMRWILPVLLITFLVISIGFIIFGSLGPGISLILGIIMIPVTILISIISVKIIGEMGISPSSSMAIILIFVILMIMGLFIESSENIRGELTLMVIISGMIFLCTMALSSDVIWDMKTGLYAGTSPFHLIKGQTLGIMIGLPMAGISAVLLSRLVMDNPGWAPQAFMITSMATWFLSGSIPWTFILLGLLIGILVELLTGMGTAFAIGMFIPTYVPFGIFLGAAGRNIWERKWLNRKIRENKWSEKQVTMRTLDTYVVMIGLILGEALIGVIMAMIMMING